MRLILVRIWRDSLPSPFLGTIPTTVFGASIFLKILYCICQQVAVFTQNAFQFINLMMTFDKIRTQTKTSKK